MQTNDEGQESQAQKDAVFNRPGVSADDGLDSPSHDEAPYEGPAPEASWQAKEFSDHQRPMGWYVIYVVVSLVVIVGTYLLLRDFVAVFVLSLAAAIFAFSTSRHPREMEYMINEHGISVGSRHYPHDTFKCFNVSDDATGSTISLQPMKRYLPPLSLRCPLDKEEEVMGTLNHYLPYEEKRNQLVDTITHKFHF